MTWDLVNPTFIENWPVELKVLTVNQQDVPLTVQEAIALGKRQVELHEFWEGFTSLEDPSTTVEAVTARLETAVRRVVGQGAPGAFIRLGSRSPKDSYWWWHAPERGREGQMWPVLTGEEGMKTLLETSERINDDLLQAVAQDYSPHIWVRAWHDIEPFQEFRCFVKGGKLVAISQYDYMGGKRFAALQRDKSLYMSAVTLFFNKRILPVLHLENAVVDVFVTLQVMPSGRGRKASATLLEINPYFEYTDPCLFTWEEIEALDPENPPTVKIREET